MHNKFLKQMKKLSVVIVLTIYLFFVFLFSFQFVFGFFCGLLTVRKVFNSRISCRNYSKTRGSVGGYGITYKFFVE